MHIVKEKWSRERVHSSIRCCCYCYCTAPDSIHSSENHFDFRNSLAARNHDGSLWALLSTLRQDNGPISIHANRTYPCGSVYEVRYTPNYHNPIPQIHWGEEPHNLLHQRAEARSRSGMQGVLIRVRGRGQVEEPQVQARIPQGLLGQVVAAILCYLPTMQDQSVARWCCGQVSPNSKSGRIWWEW